MFLSPLVRQLIHEKKFLGHCPKCGFILGAIDIATLKAKERTKIRVDCRGCRTTHNIKKLTKRNMTKKIIRRRTKFNRMTYEQMVEQFTHLMNLLPITASALERFKDGLYKDKKLKVQDIKKAEIEAGRSTHWNDNRILESMVKKVTGEEANAMIQHRR